MVKYIAAVIFRHRLLTAYLRIIGGTKFEAERRAKRVRTYLCRKMPEEADVGMPRYRGRLGSDESYDIPVIIAACEAEARATLAALVLRGRLTLL